MKGLILKDLLILKNQMKSLLIVLVFFIFISFVNKDFSFISFIIPFYMVMLVINTFSYDEFNHWDTFCNTLPFNKKDIVGSKYLLYITGTIGALIIGVITSYISTVIDPNIRLLESISVVIGEVAAIAIILSLMIPFIYKFGVQKGRTMFITTIIGISLIAGILIKLLNFDPTNLLNKLDHINVIFIFIGILLIISSVIYISYKVSTKIYIKKEF